MLVVVAVLAAAITIVVDPNSDDGQTVMQGHYCVASLVHCYAPQVHHPRTLQKAKPTRCAQGHSQPGQGLKIYCCPGQRHTLLPHRCPEFFWCVVLPRMLPGWGRFTSQLLSKGKLAKTTGIRTLDQSTPIVQPEPCFESQGLLGLGPFEQPTELRRREY